MLVRKNLPVYWIHNYYVMKFQTTNKKTRWNDNFFYFNLLLNRHWGTRIRSTSATRRRRSRLKQTKMFILSVHLSVVKLCTRSIGDLNIQDEIRSGLPCQFCSSLPSWKLNQCLAVTVCECLKGGVNLLGIVSSPGS